MSLILSGSDGLSDVDGSAATPAIRGTDANTGIFFGTDIIGFSEGGVEAARINADSQFVAAAGTAALPVITTTGDTNTGIFFPAADTIAFSKGGAEAMRITSTGDVGIGTSSPSQRLHVSAGAIQLDNDRDIQWGASEAAIRSTSSNLRFSISSTERMRILSTGELVVGTTSIVGAEQLGIVFSDPSGKGGLGVQVVSTTSGASFAVFRNASGTAIGSITRNTTTNAVLYNTSSDYRLKENVTPLTNALARVSALKPVQWLWKDCDGVVGEGFIAHEVQDVVPAAVSGEKDAVDGEGNIKPQGMDASYLVATLTAAIQEQQAIITALTARITALENK